MDVMDIIVSQLLRHLPLLSLLPVFLAGLVAGVRLKARRSAAQRKSLVSLFSGLQTFSQDLDECNDLKKIVEDALAGTLRAFGAKHGFILLQGEAGAGLSQISACGLSAPGLEELSREAMRAYLAFASNRWGNLLAVADLGAEGLEGGSFGPQFREFVAILKKEGWKSLLILGLATERGIHGTLVAGRRMRQIPNPE